MSDPDATLYGPDLFGNTAAPPRTGLVAERFLVPPFSVLNAREGWWQERKRAWVAMGIEGELGRECDGSSSWHGRYRDGAISEANQKMAAVGDGPTVFDPTLCELAYRWFCPPAGQVVDPFAGGSVRGIVAQVLGRQYWGCDLSARQVEANHEQAARIVADNQPTWIAGDAMDELDAAPAADFVFSCPPYGDLERYSDDPRDLSTMDYHAFVAAYKRIIMRACRRLRRDRFACFVVGDFRDKRGHYRDFVSATVAAFREQGLELYNEAILITAVGSLPIRITKQFQRGRKLGKTHQNVLVFVKGDWREAARACEEPA